MSEGQRTFYSILKTDGEIRANNRLAKRYRKELDDFGVFDYERRGKTEWLVVKDHDILDIQISKKYPEGLEFQQGGRVGGILTSRDSKKGGNVEQVPVTLRFITQSSDVAFGFSAYDLTQKNGIVGILISELNTKIAGVLVIVENFDCFLRAEKFVQDADVVIYASGKLDNRIISWINDCDNISKIIHMGDYDPVGLAEFCRIEMNCKQESEFFFHESIDISIFKKYGKQSLVSDRNNAKALEKLRTYETNDSGFNLTLKILLETGLGLEQEFLLSLIE